MRPGANGRRLDWTLPFGSIDWIGESRWLLSTRIFLCLSYLFSFLLIPTPRLSHSQSDSHPSFSQSEITWAICTFLLSSVYGFNEFLSERRLGWANQAFVQGAFEPNSIKNNPSYSVALIYVNRIKAGKGLRRGLIILSSKSSCQFSLR